VVLPHLAYHLNSYRRAIASGRASRRPPRVLQVDELCQEFEATGAAHGFKVVDARQACAEIAGLTGSLPAEHLLFWCRIGGTPESLVAEHLELLFGEVRAGLAGRSASGRGVGDRAAAQPLGRAGGRGRMC